MAEQLGIAEDSGMSAECRAGCFATGSLRSREFLRGSRLAEDLARFVETANAPIFGAPCLSQTGTVPEALPTVCS